MKQCKTCKYLRPDVESEPTVRCPKCGGDYEYIAVRSSTDTRTDDTRSRAGQQIAMAHVRGRRVTAFDFKRATPDAIEREFTRIAREMGHNQLLTRRELACIPQVLGEGEQVLAFSPSCLVDSLWLLLLTDERILFLDYRLSSGLRQTTIDLDKVNAITAAAGFVLGTIRIQDGAVEREFDHLKVRTVWPFVEKAREAIQARKRNWGYARASANDTDDELLTKLERLAALRDKGILTDDEFAQQKARLLSG